jgi:predicted DNA-binding protein with PD1-like motif
LRLVDAEAIARGIIRVEPGEDVIASLESLAAAAGWEEAIVSGAGALELCELATGPGDTVTFENADLVSLAGRIGRREGGVEVVLRAALATTAGLRSGRILAAVAGRLTLIVDAVLVEPAPRAAPKRARGPSMSQPPPPPAQMGEQEARAATQPLSQGFTTKPVAQRLPATGSSVDDDEDTIAVVDNGDYIDHPQLGRCEVVGDDGSGGTRVRVASGRVLVLRLDALRILPASVEADGRHVYKVAGPRRR